MILDDDEGRKQSRHRPTSACFAELFPVDRMQEVPRWYPASTFSVSVCNNLSCCQRVTGCRTTPGTVAGWKWSGWRPNLLLLPVARRMFDKGQAGGGATDLISIGGVKIAVSGLIADSMELCLPRGWGKY